MGREKRKEKKRPALRTAPGDQAKERHLRDRNGVLHDWSAPMPKGLVAKPVFQQPKSKHHSYFEFVENKEKKKKLEFEITTDKTPPPGYEFVPIGNPELTTACKELSRERDAMIFIVSNVTSGIAPELSLALNREGHHIRETIVEEARASLGRSDSNHSEQDRTGRQNGGTEPIPKSQDEINKQADAAIRDLFPRIPNTDRQRLIDRSFKKGAMMGGKPLVGLNPEITLSRRVQLAVIAHVRHEYTRYDQLLRETTYANARKAVAPLCLDYLVKWRGDEETGRDQLDEILREVVVISDSEDDEDDENDDTEDTDMTSAEASENDVAAKSPAVVLSPAAEQEQSASAYSNERQQHDNETGATQQPTGRKLTRGQRRALRRGAAKGANKQHRGFQRYQAVRDQAWQQAVERQRRSQDQETPRPLPAPMALTRSTRYASQTVQGQEPEPYYHAEVGRGVGRDPNDHHNANGNSGYSRAPYNVLPHRADDGRSHGIAHAPSGAQQYYREAPLRETQTANGSEPIVGPRYGTSRPSSGFQTVVSRPPQDLRDYLVPSIEPASPVAPQHQPQGADTFRQRHYQQGPWESRLDRQYADAPPQNNVAYPHADEPILVRRLPAAPRDDAQRPPAMFSGYVSDSRAGFGDGRPTRSDMHDPVPSHIVDRPRGPYYHESSASLSRNAYMAEDGAIPRHEEPRSVVREEYVPQYDSAPRTASRPTVMENRVSNRDRDVLRGPSRPIVIDDGSPMVVRQQYIPRPPVDYARQEPEMIVIRRAPPSDGTVYDDRRIQGLADPYPIRHGDQHTPLDFIPVSNSFPRPHGVAPRSNEVWEPVERAPRMVNRQEQATYRREYNGAPTQHLPESRAHLPRQERVVRLEYVDYESPNDGHRQHIYEGERVYHPQYPASTRPVPDAAYQVTPRPQRHPRQDSVIYIE